MDCDGMEDLIMKCENCGKNEVTFVYQSDINGTVTKAHLCGECAEKLGYSHAFAMHNQSMMEGFFGKDWIGNQFLGDFFAPMSSLMGRVWENPLDDFFMEMPALCTHHCKEQDIQKEKEDETLLGQEEQNRFERMCRLNALRVELKQSVEREEFERAAELRDQIRELET